jgi:hypothetical protein
MIIKTYEYKPGSFMGGLFSFTAGSIMSLGSLIILWDEFVLHFPKHDFLGISLGIVYLSFPLMQYKLICIITEGWASAWEVECTEDCLYGKPKFGKKNWTLKYEEIHLIYPNKILSPLFLFSSVVLKKEDGEYMSVSVEIEHFAEFMEFIKLKAVNAKKVDFGNWPQNGRVWKY